MATGSTHPHFKKPKHQGGVLIRRVISEFRQMGIRMPQKKIIIGCSGGPDSLCLAHLLANYGARIADKVELLHINHGLRISESRSDQAFVERFGKQLGIKVKVVQILKSPRKGQSVEEWARGVRLTEFKKTSQHETSYILSAHTLNDQAETVLWRLLSGAPKPLRGGVFRSHQYLLRPLLSTSRAEILTYLAEEGLIAVNDSMNTNRRFLRASMRRDLIPILDKLFPAWVKKLAAFGAEHQKMQPPEKLNVC